MLAKTVRGRTRKLVHPKIGQLVFFWRHERAKRRESQSKWVGPGYIVGIQGHNAWISCGGRCFLVASEHIREAVGDEGLYGDPEVQRAIALFKKVPEEATFEDLTGQQHPPQESLDVEAEPLAQDLAPDEPSAPSREENVPADIVKAAMQVGWQTGSSGNPCLVSRNAWAYRTPEPKLDANRFPYRTSWGYLQGKWKCLEKEINWTDLKDPHEIIPNGPTGILVTQFHGYSRKERFLDDLPPNWKKPRVETPAEVHVVGHDKVTSKTKLKRMMEKEIPYDRIPQEQKQLFLESEEREWQSWLDYESCEVLSLEESRRVLQEKPERVLPSRFVYRNKHAGLVDESGNPLYVKGEG